MSSSSSPTSSAPATTSPTWSPPAGRRRGRTGPLRPAVRRRLLQPGGQRRCCRPRGPAGGRPAVAGAGGIRHLPSRGRPTCSPELREPDRRPAAVLSPRAAARPDPRPAAERGWPLADPLGKLAAPLVSRRYPTARRRSGLRSVGPWPSPPPTPAVAIHRPPRTRCRPPRSPSSPPPWVTTTLLRRRAADRPADLRRGHLLRRLAVDVRRSRAGPGAAPDRARRPALHLPSPAPGRRRGAATLTIDQVRVRGATDIISSSVVVTTLAASRSAPPRHLLPRPEAAA